MTRHKAVKTTLSIGASTEWNDDHISDFTSVVTIEPTFVTPVITTEWDLGQTNGGVNPVQVFEDHHAMAKLNTGATTGKISSMRFEFNGAAGNITYIDDAPIMTMAVGLTAFHTAGTVAEFGLIDSASAAAFTANQHGAYFRVTANKLYAVTGSGASETTTDITPAGGVPDWENYRIVLTSANAKFYVTSMTSAAATHTLTLPTNDLTMKFSIISGNNVDSTMYVDGVGLTRNKYSG